MDLDKRIKDAEELFKQLKDQEEQVAKAQQQTIGRLAAYNEIKNELQTEQENTETNSIC